MFWWQQKIFLKKLYKVGPKWPPKNPYIVEGSFQNRIRKGRKKALLSPSCDKKHNFSKKLDLGDAILGLPISYIVEGFLRSPHLNLENWISKHWDISPGDSHLWGTRWPSWNRRGWARIPSLTMGQLPMLATTARMIMVLPETARRDPRRGEIPVMRIRCPQLSDFPAAGARRSIILQKPHLERKRDIIV